MNYRERILAASRGQRTDKLPFFHFWRHCQTGRAERECRNRGMGVCWLRPPYAERLHGVDVEEKRTVVKGRAVVRRTFSTPVGAIYEDELREPGTGNWKGTRSWKGHQPWITERLLKGPADYKVLKYIVEHTEYVADYFGVEQAMEWLGEDGVVLDQLPHSPMQMLMIYWLGSEEGRFFFHMADYPDLVEELCQAVSKAREPLYEEIAAKSPAPVAWCGDNIDGVLANPKLFARYFMPEYEKQAKPLHRAGKLMACHMDGRLKNLQELIGRTPIDIIEAIHPPPMGDLSIREALAAWPGKVLWIGFPSSAYLEGPAATERCALELLREAGSGERVAIAASTENLVSNENLLALTSVLEKAELPLTRAAVDRIAEALAPTLRNKSKAVPG